MIAYENDTFPLDSKEWADNDDDGFGDNSDTDDDNDGWSDIDEDSCNTDSMISQQIPVDYDSDGICDLVDDDDDNDGWLDTMDVRPLDSSIQTEWDIIKVYTPLALGSIIFIVALTVLIIFKTDNLILTNTEKFPPIYSEKEFVRTELLGFQ